MKLILQAWSVKHNNDETKKWLYPVILESLLSKRNQLQNELKKIEKQIEEYEKKTIIMTNNINLYYLNIHI